MQKAKLDEFFSQPPTPEAGFLPHEEVLSVWKAKAALSVDEIAEKSWVPGDFAAPIKRKEIEFASGSKGSFIGQLNEKRQPHGVGRAIEDNGKMVEGQFQNGKPNGWGREYLDGVMFFEGLFKDG